MAWPVYPRQSTTPSRSSRSAVAGQFRRNLLSAGHAIQDHSFADRSHGLAEFIYSDPELRRRIYHLAATSNIPGIRLSRNLNILQCKIVVRAAFESKGFFRSLSTRRELRCASSPFDVARVAGAASTPAHTGFRPYAKRSLQRSIELRHRSDERDIRRALRRAVFRRWAAEFRRPRAPVCDPVRRDVRRGKVAGRGQPKGVEGLLASGHGRPRTAAVAAGIVKPASDHHAGMIERHCQDLQKWILQ